MIAKTDFDAKLSSLNRRVTAYKSKNLLVKNELKKTFNSSYFIAKSHFEEDGTQNYLAFRPICKYFKVIANTGYVSAWKSKGLSDQSIKPPGMSDNVLIPVLNYYDTKTRVKFNGSCLQRPKLSYTHGALVNIYIVYELSASSSQSEDPTLENCLFGTATLTKSADDINKYGYSGYGIGFNGKPSFSFPSGAFRQNVIIFGVDMSFTTHVDNNKKNILILGKGPTQGFENTLTAAKMYSFNFTVTKKRCCLNLHYN